MVQSKLPTPGTSIRKWALKRTVIRNKGRNKAANIHLMKPTSGFEVERPEPKKYVVKCNEAGVAFESVLMRGIVPLVHNGRLSCAVP